MKNISKLIMILMTIFLYQNNANAIDINIGPQEENLFSMGVGVDPFNLVNFFVSKKFSVGSAKHDNLGIRVDFATGWTVLDSFFNSNDKFTLSHDMMTIGAVADYYPFDARSLFENLRLSAGLYYGKININKMANVLDSVFLDNNNIEIITAGIVESKYSNNFVAPYIGAGLDFYLLGIKFYLNAGVMFSTSGKYEASISEGNYINGVPAYDNPALYQQALSALKNELENDIGIMENIYPVVRLGLTYSF